MNIYKYVAINEDQKIQSYKVPEESIEQPLEKKNVF